jgi:curved DNA-binding protein CbpA
MRYPYLVLEVAEDASPEEIRRAYLRKIREHPPERSAERFQEIVEAYDLVRDDISAARLKLFGLPGNKHVQRLSDLLPRSGPRRNRVGLELWLQANRERQ